MLICQKKKKKRVEIWAYFISFFFPSSNMNIKHVIIGVFVDVCAELSSFLTCVCVLEISILFFL